MSAFDDCTLAEVELITSQCLGGKAMSDDDIDPLMLAGGVMWVTERRGNLELSWPEFKSKTRMGDIKAFSAQMQEDEANPTNGHKEPVT